MTPNEELCLKAHLTMEKTILWRPDEHTARFVKSITLNSFEPSYCAYFENGEYIALYGCDLTDFYKITKIGN